MHHIIVIIEPTDYWIGKIPPENRIIDSIPIIGGTLIFHKKSPVYSIVTTVPAINSIADSQGQDDFFILDLFSELDRVSIHC